MKPSKIGYLMILLLWGAAAVAWLFPQQTMQILWMVQHWMDKF
jgi:hypothetical protein